MNGKRLEIRQDVSSAEYAAGVAQNDTRLLRKEALELAFLVLGRLLAIFVQKGNSAGDILDWVLSGLMPVSVFVPEPAMTPITLPPERPAR